MPLLHQVAPGECLSSIGESTGFHPQTLWHLPENASLRANADSPYVLKEGDTVHVPDVRKKSFSLATDQVHRFKRKAVPSQLRIRFLDSDRKPRARLDYVLDIQGRLISNRTDEGGWLVEWIEPQALECHLELIDGAAESRVVEQYRIQLGRLNPSAADAGIRARLENIGLRCGDDEAGLVSAISNFQELEKLPVTGKVDAVTFDRIMGLHLS